MPRSHVDDVGARGRIDAHERTAHAQILLFHRLNRGGDEGVDGHDRRRLGRVDDVRRREVEVDREERRAPLRDDQVVAAVEANFELRHGERIAVCVDGRCLDGVGALLNFDVRIRVVEADRALREVAGRERRDAKQVREIRELREVHARRLRQRFDSYAVRALKRDRQYVDRIAHEVAVGVGEADEQGAAIAASGWRNRCARSRASAANERERGGREPEQ